MNNRIRVVAGILINREQQVLIAERTGGGPFQGMWEFPGGKIAGGESPNDALRRELREEIGVDVVNFQFLMQLLHDYADRSVDLHFFLVTAWRGDPCGLEGQALRWQRAEDIAPGIMLPADVPVLEALTGRQIPY